MTSDITNETRSRFRSTAEAVTHCVGPASFWMPVHLMESAWHEHAPFAFWLTEAIKPRTFVELGTHRGFSYLAFCQAVQRLALPTSCHAIDTWIGDDHAGFYGEEVFSTLSATNDTYYSACSHLIRGRFDDALPYFQDGSIDLLHIDGRHAHSDVLHDFETWRPKLSERAVVLFHDTNVRERGFGVWRLWEELAAEHPSFEFLHGCGLGILAPGRTIPEGLRALLGSDPNERVAIRNAYARLGAAVSRQHELDMANARAAGLEEARKATASATERDAAAEAAEAASVAEGDAAARTAAAESAAAAAAGAVLTERARLEAAVARAEQERDAALAELERAREYVTGAAAIIAERARLEAALAAAQTSQSAGTAERDAVLNSTIWRSTGPLRRAGEAMPAPLRRNARRLARAGYWLATGQFGRRMADWRAARAARPSTAISMLAAATQPSQQATYERWVRECDTLNDGDRAAIRAHIGRLAHRPLISVVMPAYETPERVLSEAIASVQAQLYPHWELCVADDGSPSSDVARVLTEAAAEDPRVKWILRQHNGHIAAATNSALGLASGEFVALMDHDDLLSERALYEVAVELEAHPDADILYSDEDQFDSAGRRFRPYFKPDWNIALMLGHNLVNHLAVYRRTLVERVGNMRLGYEGSQDYDLTLRAAAATEPARIRHIPAILYHWRQHASFSKEREAACVDSARRAIRDYLAGQGAPDAEIGPLPAIPMWTRVSWPLPDPAPKVSVIIPTRDKPDLLARCSAAVLQRTDYPDLELLIVDNDTHDAEALAVLARLAGDPRVRVLPYPGAFNYSAMNNAAARAATGEVLVLLNNDIDVIHRDWLREMVSLAVRPGIGAVGAKLLYGNNTIQHAGVVLGIGSFAGGPGVAGHYGQGLPADEVGCHGYLVMAREAAAVTGACLAVRKSAYQQVSGLDETNLSVGFNDVDFCLRLRDAGLRNLWTPFATLYHLESASRGSDLSPSKLERFTREVRHMRHRWGPVLDNDPFYSVNFSRADHTFRLAIPARREKPWRPLA